MKHFLKILLLLLTMVTPVHAIEPFIIQDIRVEGLQRLEAGTVFNYLPLKVGDQINDEEAQLSIKALFQTGFFDDVKLERQGNVLVVKVKERRSIAELKLTGNKEIDTAAIEQALQAAGLVEGRIFSKAALARIKQELQNTYLSIGHYSATVTTEVEELARNRVAIALTINEGRVAKIKKINIVGAQRITTATLKGEMQLRDRRGWLPFSKRNQYSKQKLEADLEAIRSYYQNRGYHDFAITSSSVNLSQNKQSVFIDISLHEGEPYVFGAVEVEGEYSGVSGVERSINIPSGQPFSRKLVSQSRAAIASRFADAGYAFVEVTPILTADKQNKIVATVFSIVPNQKVYVRTINITGNTYTRDEVIRRELRQLEAAVFSAQAIRRSRDRLRRLGLFQDVVIETPSVAGTNQVDVNVVVTERDTGSIQLSAGYSDADGTIVGASYQQRNLLGSGRELKVELNNSDAVRVAEISYVNPYHTANGVSRGIRLSTRRVDSAEVNTSEYVLNTDALGLDYRIPISETNSLNLGFSVETLELESTAATPDDVDIIGVIENYPQSDQLLMSLGVSKDTRDDYFFPTQGGNGLISLEASVPSSDFEYYKLNLQGSYYLPLSPIISLKGGVAIGYGDGYGDSSDTGLPFFKNYFAGGSRSVRGYDGRSLGPMDNDNTPKGGNRRVLTSLELLLPPFGGSGNKDKRFSLFVDGGMVYGFDDVEGTLVEDKLDLGGLRYSAGLVLNWFSPLGPFSISYGVPLNQEVGDDVEKFQISFGTVFR